MTLPSLQELAATTTAATVVGTAILWLVREKIARWVKATVHPRFNAVEARATAVEARASVLERNHSNHESELMRVAEAMERTSENMNDTMQRLSLAMEKIADKHEETSHAVARIEGALERRIGPRT
jgi:methyl-accepting chemotaxis protein